MQQEKRRRLQSGVLVVSIFLFFFAGQEKSTASSSSSFRMFSSNIFGARIGVRFLGAGAATVPEQGDCGLSDALAGVRQWASCPLAEASLFR